MAILDQFTTEEIGRIRQELKAREENVENHEQYFNDLYDYAASIGLEKKYADMVKALTDIATGNGKNRIMWRWYSDADIEYAKHRRNAGRVEVVYISDEEKMVADRRKRHVQVKYNQRPGRELVGVSEEKYKKAFTDICNAIKETMEDN